MARLFGSLAAVGLWFSFAGCDDVPEAHAGFHEGGPLSPPPHNAYLIRYEEGHVFTDGFQRLRLPDGSAHAVVDHVELLGAQGLEIVDVLYAGSERKYGVIQVVDHFPPRNRAFGPLEPIEGAVVTPGDLGIEIVMGLRVTHEGVAVREGIRIYYRVGETGYFTDFPAGIFICPDDMTDGACEEKFEALTGWGLFN